MTDFEINALLLSIKIGILSTILILVPGIFMGWVLAKKNFFGKTIVDSLIHLPLVIPPIGIGYILLIIFGKNSFKIPIKHCSSSFGKNSCWEWACKNNNVCNISLGLELNGGATFCHYVEEYCKVPYRKYINLNYIVKDKQNKIIKKKIT